MNYYYELLTNNAPVYSRLIFLKFLVGSIHQEIHILDRKNNSQELHLFISKINISDNISLCISD